MFCYNCGQQLVEGAKFCSACGTKIVNATPTPEPQPQPKPDVTPSPAPQTEPVIAPKPTPQHTEAKQDVPKPQRNKKLIFIVIALLVAGGIGLAMLIEDEMHSDSPYKIESYDGTGSAESTFRGFIAAIQRRDVDAVANYLTYDNRYNLEQQVYSMNIHSYEIISSQESGHEAVVKARLYTSDGTQTHTYRFVKQNGKWLLSN